MGLLVSRLEHILSRKKRREEKLRAALGSIVDQLRALGALKIVLFGSLARAEVDVRSDLDLLVIMPATRTGEEWTRLVYERLERGVAADIIVYNESEFHAMLPRSSFLREVLRTGSVVHEQRPS
ncbi:MAG: nucleotidyltransferase domain-containing protein [Firmicutes bacterium]|nr:nucleotidyltransferase domain-containing protein [Bacillota bacterium]